MGLKSKVTKTAAELFLAAFNLPRLISNTEPSGLFNQV